MTVPKYLAKQNKIIKHYTGLILTPEKQIEECEQYKLSMNDDATITPYCMAYIEKDGNCEKCSMSKQHNKCTNKDSTYNEVMKYCYKNYNTLSLVSEKNPFFNELKSLVTKYNKELK